MILGIVNPSVGEYEAGTEVTIEAIPSAGYRFEGWSGEWSGTENPLTITMNSDKVLNANFQVLIYTAENGVTIKCSEAAEIGDTANINGKLYTVVSEQELRGMVQSGVDLSGAVTTKITDMHGLFYEMFEINPDIGTWDVSNVTNMQEMFYGTISFNQDIGSWDVSSVIDMDRMFFNTPFNYDISSWNVISVNTMREMFTFCDDFNQDIGSWDVRNVYYMSWMFSYCTSFNQDIGSWDVSRVRGLAGMFNGATSFNQDLSNWDLSSANVCNDFAIGADSWTLPKPNFIDCDCGCK